MSVFFYHREFSVPFDCCMFSYAVKKLGRFREYSRSMAPVSKERSTYCRLVSLKFFSIFRNMLHILIIFYKKRIDAIVLLH